jgi:hypothetical protein
MTLVSRLAKMRAMAGREIAGRGIYAMRVARERALHRSNWLVRQGRLRRGLGRSLAARPDWHEAVLERRGAGAFFVGVSDDTVTRTLSEYRDEVTKARRIADEVCRHEIEFFGTRFCFGERIDWHADPVTRAPWPRAYHADVPVHGGNRGFGDVKYVWELNRHQFLVDLAKIALIDRSVRHADALRRLLEDWLHEVPYATGAPWACALEPAFRAWSWMWAYHLLRAAGPLDPGFHLTWLTGFYDHGRFLYRHLETYSSPYNHLIGEASALFALGILFPEFREASAWVRRGRSVLESTVDSQFHEDGGSVEQSTFYHHATLGFYLLAALLGQRNGVHLSGSIWAAIERGIAFSMWMMQPDGRVPRIGGADDGKPIRLEHLRFYDFRPYLAIGAVLFSRPDFKHAAGRFWEDALWLLGRGGARRFEEAPAGRPAVSVILPESGYHVARSEWSADADYLCFDCGPQAGGLRQDDVPSAAHGHADCLSVTVALGGREVLVDPGFFCYNGDPAWEVHFRRTLAHNTIVVDGADQARHVSKMVWTRTYTARWEAWDTGAGVAWARGSHDGYTRQGASVVHRRTAWLREDGYVVLFDEITGGGPRHQLEAVFQFAPGVLALDGHVEFERRFHLAWAAPVDLDVAVSCGDAGPAGGWVAPSLGVRQAAPRLALRAPLEEDRFVLLTVLADASRNPHGTDRRVTTTATADLLRARIRGADYEDEVLAAVRGPVTGPGLWTDAPLVIVRRHRGRPAEVFQAGGTRVEMTCGELVGTRV